MPKNLPRRKVLQAWATFTLRQLFDENSVDPANSPALAKEFEVLRTSVHAWADDPAGLEKDFYEHVAGVREAFVKANPRLRIRYATKIKPLDTEH